MSAFSGPPPHMSYSQLSSMLKCGEQYRLEKVCHVPSRPSWAGVGGSAVHTATEVHDYATFGLRHPDPRVTLDPMDWEAHFETAIAEEEERSGFPRSEFRASGRASKANPNKEDFGWWMENGPQMVQRWVTWRQIAPWEIWMVDDNTPAIELEVNANYGSAESPTLVQARIDRVMVHTGDGTLAVVDIKSGSRTPEGTLQLGQYAESIRRCDVGPRPQYGFYWMARTGISTEPVDIDRWTAEFFDYAYKGAAERKKRGDMYLPVVSNLCASCGVRDFCRYVGGERAGEVPAAWEEEK